MSNPYKTIESLFDICEILGYDKKSVEAMIEALTLTTNAILIEHANETPPVVVSAVNKALITYATICHTLMNNPLYGSDALGDQFRNSLRIVLKDAKEVHIRVPRKAVTPDGSTKEK